MIDHFHQQVPIELRLGRTVHSGEINRVLRSMGFELHYDVYSLPRPDGKPHSSWQSKNLAHVELLSDGKEVDAQEACDTVRLIYPLATVDSSLIDAFLAAVRNVQEKMGGRCGSVGATSS